MILVAVSVVLLDYASQAAINPCESLMADLLHSANGNSNGHSAASSGYSVYSGMLSLGSCVGYFLSSLDWENMGGKLLSTQEQTALMIVLVLFVISLGVTMVVADEKPYIKPRENNNIHLTDSNGDIEQFPSTSTTSMSCFGNDSVGLTRSASPLPRARLCRFRIQCCGIRVTTTKGGMVASTVLDTCTALHLHVWLENDKLLGHKVIFAVLWNREFGNLL